MKLIEELISLRQLIIENNDDKSLKKLFNTFHKDFSKKLFNQLKNDYKQIENLQKALRKDPKYFSDRGPWVNKLHNYMKAEGYELFFDKNTVDGHILLRFWKNDEKKELKDSSFHIVINFTDLEHQIKNLIITHDVNYIDLLKPNTFENVFQKVYTKLDNKIGKKYVSHLF